jgi:hypothetical protein
MQGLQFGIGLGASQIELTIFLFFFYASDHFRLFLAGLHFKVAATDPAASPPI